MKMRFLFTAILFSILITTVQAQEKYYFSKQLDVPYDVAIEKLKDVLKDHQFGVVSENAMHETIMSKVPGAKMDPYIILGVCNAGYAYKLIQEEENVGLLLPCKVVVKYLEMNLSEVAILDPNAAGSLVDNDAASKVFEEVSSQLKKVLKAL